MQCVQACLPVCTDVYITVQVYTSECTSVGVCTSYCQAGVSACTILYLLLQFLVWQLLYANKYTYVHAKGEYTSVYKGVCQCVRMCTSAYKCIQVSAEVSACVHVIVQE